jgi:hypothetical protein
MHKDPNKKGRSKMKQNSRDASQLITQAFDKESSSWKSLLWFAVCLFLFFCAKIVPILIP